MKLIVHQVGLSCQAIYNYLKIEQPSERTRIDQQRKPFIEPYKEYLVKRWNEEVRNSRQVYRELKEMGYPGSDQPILRYYVQFRKEKDFRKFKQVDPSQQALPPRSVWRQCNTASPTVAYSHFGPTGFSGGATYPLFPDGSHLFLSVARFALSPPSLAGSAGLPIWFCPAFAYGSMITSSTSSLHIV